MIKQITGLILSYLLGSIPTAYILGRLRAWTEATWLRQSRRHQRLSRARPAMDPSSSSSISPREPGRPPGRSLPQPGQPVSSDLYICLQPSLLWRP